MKDMRKIAAAIAAVTIAAVTLAGCAAVEEFPDETDAIPVLGDAVPEDNIDMTETISETTAAPESITTVSESVSETEETSDTPEETYITEAETYAETEASTVIETVTEAETTADTTAETTAESGGEITKIDLTYYEVTLEEGKSSMPIVTMYPEAAPDKSEIWTSSDEKVATVDGIGNITAVSEGICTVKVQSAVCPEVYAEVKVTVTAAPAAQSVTGLTYIDGILVVNKTYALPSDYNPGVDPNAQAAFDKMQAAAAKEGLNIYISSGFRSYDYQSGLYDRYVKRSGKAEADRYSARPGHSEHQTGLAFDLNSIDMTFADTDECAWVNEHCAEYGFIIRYPQGSESITGYMYEPWHLRYLGTENAKKVYDSGLTLEEYLGIDSKYAE